MKWLARLFGNIGVIRFEGVSFDNIKYSGKMHIETIGLTPSDIEDHAKEVVYVETGIRLKSIKITGYYKS